MFLKISKTNSLNKINCLVRRTITILADGNGKYQNQTLCTGQVFSSENENNKSFKDLDKLKLKNYEFSSIRFQYTRKDAIEHALSVGVRKGDPFSFNYLTETSTNFQVLPSFPFSITNKILFGMLKEKTIPGAQHYVEIVRPIPGEGMIDLRIKVVNVLDKGSKTLYHFIINGYEPNADRLLFKYEYQMLEVGKGGWSINAAAGCKTKSKNLPYPDAEFAQTSPDAVLFFQYKSFPSGTYVTQTDLKICAVGGTFQKILAHYTQGDSYRFKSGRVGFTNPVFPNELIEISIWRNKRNKNKISFAANVKRNGNGIVNVMKNGIIHLR